MARAGRPLRAAPPFVPAEGSSLVRHTQRRRPAGGAPLRPTECDRALIVFRGDTMKATKKLHELGQSLWLDNITRDLLTQGVLKHYVEELSVTGLTSNPTIFDHAIKNSTAYDAAIRKKLKAGKSGEGLFFELALEDLTQAADLFRPNRAKNNGVDGWV